MVAQRADTLVYSLRYYDRRWAIGLGRGGVSVGSGGGAGGKAALMRISKETGAAFYEPTDKQPIAKIYSQIEEELRNQYNLGYTPDNAPGSGEYRRIQLTVRRKDLVVQTREGYYGRP